MISAWESFRTSPSRLIFDLPKHLFPVPRATTLYSSGTALSSLPSTLSWPSPLLRCLCTSDIMRTVSLRDRFTIDVDEWWSWNVDCWCWWRRLLTYRWLRARTILSLVAFPWLRVDCTSREPWSPPAIPRLQRQRPSSLLEPTSGFLFLLLLMDIKSPEMN